MSIKLICTDIDGTLLNTLRWLSTETVTAFAKAKLPTILASSRMPSALTYLQEGLNILGSPLIAYNGGLILGTNGKVIQSNTFSLSILEVVIAHQAQCNYNLSIYADDDWYTTSEDYWTKREINNTRVTPTLQEPQQTLRQLAIEKRGIHKVMCMGDEQELDTLVSLLANFTSQVHLYRSKDTYLEITPRDIDKAKALKIVLQEEYDFGMEAVMAFGDNHNDDELIKNAGRGVAVANATDTLKSLADYVSPFTNKEHGVAFALTKFINNA
jgi:Cof subfamily protein (haloacid dehalogenase superfamily)